MLAWHHFLVIPGLCVEGQLCPSCLQMCLESPAGQRKLLLYLFAFLLTGCACLKPATLQCEACRQFPQDLYAILLLTLTDHIDSSLTSA